MFPKHSGMAPAKLLFETIRTPRDVRLQMVDGSFPFNVLDMSRRYHKFDRFPMSDGSGPGKKKMKQLL